MVLIMKDNYFRYIVNGKESYYKILISDKKYLINKLKPTYYISHQDNKAYLLENEIKNKVNIIFNIEGIIEFFNMDINNPGKFYRTNLNEWKQIRRSSNEI